MGGSRRRGRLLAAGWIAMYAGLAAAGCSRQPAPKPAGASPPEPGGTIVVAMGQEPESLVPYGERTSVSSDVEGFLFRMLAITNPDFGSFSPDVARAWEWSPDRKALTMSLRNDVYWSDGVQLTADDVAFSFDVARDSVVGWRSRHWKREIDACEVVDPFRVRFHFASTFLEQFRYAKEGWIVPKHLLAGVPRDQWRTSAFAHAPVGCGPFKLESWEPGQRIVLVRNERFFGAPKPWVDRVVLEFVPEASTRLGRLRAGSVDVVASPDLPLRDAAELRDAYAAGKSDVRILSVPGRSYDFIGYNASDPLFRDRRVREALTLAIDRREIVRALCHGFAEVLDGPIVPILWAHNPRLPSVPYDAEAAKRLLAAAGWRDTDADGVLDRDGVRFEFSLITNSNNPLRAQAIVPVQENWRQIGVKANLEAMEMQAALQRRSDRKYQAYYGGWESGLAVTATLEGLWSCASRNGRSNFTDYCNPRVDSLNALAAAAPDADAAKPLLFEAQALLAADHPYTWMYCEQNVMGIGPRVQGVVVDGRGAFVNMEDWYVPASLRARPAGS
jgi:peptide/nickel transport system substrate-binding protein